MASHFTEALADAAENGELPCAGPLRRPDGSPSPRPQPDRPSTGSKSTLPAASSAFSAIDLKKEQSLPGILKIPRSSAPCPMQPKTAVFHAAASGTSPRPTRCPDGSPEMPVNSWALRSNPASLALSRISGVSTGGLWHALCPAQATARPLRGL